MGDCRSCGGQRSPEQRRADLAAFDAGSVPERRSESRQGVQEIERRDTTEDFFKVRTRYTVGARSFATLMAAEDYARKTRQVIREVNEPAETD